MQARSYWRSLLVGMALLLPLIGARGAMGADACSETHQSVETACSIDGTAGMVLIHDAITTPGGANVYAVAVAQPGSQLSIWLEDLPADYDLHLVAENGDLVDQSAEDGSLPEILRQLDLAPGTYFVFVKSYAVLGFDPERSYSLYVELVASSSPVAEELVELATETPLPTATPLATATPLPSATPTPNVPTVYISFSLDPSTGWPSGTVRDQAGQTRSFGTGNTTTVNVRFGDRIVFDAVPDRFSLLFDCGPSNPSVQPCNFNASSRGELPELRVTNRDPIGGFITISGPNHYGATRPDNPSRYVTDPLTTLFINPNPR